MSQLQFILSKYPDGVFVVLSRVDGGRWHVSQRWRDKYIATIKSRAIRDKKENIFIFDDKLRIVSHWRLSLEKDVDFVSVDGL